MTSESRHVSVWIDAAPRAVYAYICDPRNLPDWAAGLAEGTVEQVRGAWVVSSPMGEATVEFAAANDLGVVDHRVRLADGQTFYNLMRVIPGGDDKPL